MRKQIENTKVFKALSPQQELIFKRRERIISIERNFVIAQTTGLENWIRITSPSKFLIDVITELLNS
ncbi:hypothetical protein [Flavobacterium sp. '19STA2R22 D10 B1']|uniref:hypothetical protein n=1 Tax=Flavobacterium aerium TaxID=3037261 RepID=UPI00278BC186|nr:hypothetical protein [Flavobacterium sp. '19STA2R22 D10 B1']